MQVATPNLGGFCYRFLKTERDNADATSGSGLPLANFPLTMQMGDTGLVTGPSGSASQAILQSDLQAKYDGSKTLGRHILSYVFNVNRIAAACSCRPAALRQVSSRMLAPPRRPSRKSALSRVAMPTH